MQALDASTAMSLAMGESIPPEEEPGPGQAHPNGPRHSNDHEDHRCISIIPTADEIFCELPPYLPKTGDGYAPSPHVANPIDRYLDWQFRLLREDMLAPVKRGIQGFLSENALEKMKRK